MNSQLKVSAVILAAGASRRMGQSKMLMPWGNTTVIGKVVQTLLEAGVVDPVIVTGRSAAEVHDLLDSFSVHWAHNPGFETTEMLQSLQIGMRALPPNADAFLVALGDQPQIETGIVRKVLANAALTELALLIPSYQQRRGHPWLVKKALWDELLSLDSSATLRQFLNAHANQIAYLNVDSSSVLMDLDTPEDYARYKTRQAQEGGKNE
jgi:molybdenum cofactor cytidylyltransferase